MKFKKWDFIKNRYTQMGLLFFFLFMILIGRLLVLQAIRGNEYRNISERVATRVIPLKAPRGNIYDRNGEILAWNRPSFNVDLFYYELLKGDINGSILEAVDIIERNGDKVIGDFPIKAEKKDSNRYIFDFSWVKTEILNNKKIKKLQSEWLKIYNFDKNITAKQAYQKLTKIYDIDENIYSVEEIIKILNIRHKIKLSGFKAYYPVTIAKDIKPETMAALEELRSEMPGVVINPTFIREYPNKNTASHILGYIGKITLEDWDKNKDYYTKYGYNAATDLVGRWEIEKVLESQLHGLDGGQTVQVDVKGRTIRVLDEKQPIPGDDVYLTIDINLQRMAEQALKETMENIRLGKYGEKFSNAYVGSVVVLDIKTGDVLALANQPNYDPNFSVTGEIDWNTWKMYNPSYKNPDNPKEESLDPTLPRPMVNNAVRGVFPPGSTFKMVVATAGLEEGVIAPDSIIVDKGRYTKISNVNAPACWIWNDRRGTHGPENVIAALRDSCNYFFYEVGNRLGIETIERYARMFGLGETTGIELPKEASGIVAGKHHNDIILIQTIKKRLAILSGKVWEDLGDTEKQLFKEAATIIVEGRDLDIVQKQFKRLNIQDSKGAYDIWRYVIDYGWNDGKTLSASIGQAENTYTPLQMANYAAILANGGTRYQTHLVDKIVSIKENKTYETRPKIMSKIPMSIDNKDALFKGMRAVTSDMYEGISGTAARYFKDFPIDVAGKTGTAQFKGHDSYGWFVSFAPYENPEIAVAVVVANAGHGGYVIPIAKAIYETYFKINL